MREGGAALCSFIDWFLLLLVACLLAWCLSRVSCERESFISSSLWFEQFAVVWNIYLSLVVLCGRERERLKWKRWATMLLVVMLESSSRSAPRSQAMLMACSTILWTWRSTIVEISCSSSIAAMIECSYSRAMMMMDGRSCPSSASVATNQASSGVHGTSRSITIMIASSLLIPAIIEYNHGH